VRFSFDPSQPPGDRIDPASVTTGHDNLPLDLKQQYTLATKSYLAEGKDGYDVLEVCGVMNLLPRADVHQRMVDTVQHACKELVLCVLGAGVECACGGTRERRGQGVHECPTLQLLDLRLCVLFAGLSCVDGC
jgi:hypothetical protein